MISPITNSRKFFNFEFTNLMERYLFNLGMAVVLNRLLNTRSLFLYHEYTIKLTNLQLNISLKIVAKFTDKSILCIGMKNTCRIHPTSSSPLINQVERTRDPPCIYLLKKLIRIKQNIMQVCNRKLKLYSSVTIDICCKRTLM